ncbi:MAG: twin-arginine translocase TatA/TatE family subunit [Candidatus Marinimicrobia bacterium]|nr:twin-arginine translocase TatA/TatE family subunit [Candidatus Neomarinimicrobiota bacterium]|tara:strand:- start:2544 stop:2729 length:186 start_codon:yes stop_codon:yes gene_type:complete
MFNLGTGELLIIFLVILLLFGAKRLPELARGLGKGINEFKDAVETGKKEILDAEKGNKNEN